MIEQKTPSYLYENGSMQPKEVEVLDYKTLKKMFDKHKDPMLTIKEFIKAEKLLIVKTKTNDTNRNE